MVRRLMVFAGWMILVIVLACFVRVRNDVVAERYALGEVVRHEAKISRQGQVIREHWERLIDPATLEGHAHRVLGMQMAKTGQILK